jgi:hypothetical protein
MEKYFSLTSSEIPLLILMDQHKDQRMISDILHELKFLHFKFAVDIQHVYKLLEENSVGRPTSLHNQMHGSSSNGSSSRTPSVPTSHQSNNSTYHGNSSTPLNVNFDGRTIKPQVLLVDGRQLTLSILKELKRVHSVLVVVIFVEREEKAGIDGLIRQFQSQHSNHRNENYSPTNDRIQILVKPTNSDAVMDILTRFLQ